MLIGEAKKAYQREYMADYMRSKRASLLRPITIETVKTPIAPVDNVKTCSPIDAVRQRLVGMGLNLVGNKVLPQTPQSTPAPLDYVPLYNPRVHKKGDKVRFPGRHGIYTVPELDGDGNPVW